MKRLVATFIFTVMFCAAAFASEIPDEYQGDWFVISKGSVASKRFASVTSKVIFNESKARIVCLDVDSITEGTMNDTGDESVTFITFSNANVIYVIYDVGEEKIKLMIFSTKTKKQISSMLIKIEAAE